MSARNTAKRGKNPMAVFNTAGGNAKTGMIRTPRKVMVTARVSIVTKFTAPRIEMGEYNSPHF